MAVPRFHCPAALDAGAVDTEYELPDAVAHHALRVLRLEEGDHLTLFTGGKWMRSHEPRLRQKLYPQLCRMCLLVHTLQLWVWRFMIKKCFDTPKKNRGRVFHSRYFNSTTFH